MLVMTLVNRMTLPLSGYSSVPLATLKAAFSWTPAALHSQQIHSLCFTIVKNIWNDGGSLEGCGPEAAIVVSNSALKCCLVCINDSLESIGQRGDGITLVVLLLLLFQPPLGSLQFLVPRSDLVYQEFPSFPAPPSVPSERPGHCSRVLLLFVWSNDKGHKMFQFFGSLNTEKVNICYHLKY